MVTSTTADYFVLYVKHDVDGTEVELPVLVKLGEAGTTTLAENVEALPAERYRVEKFLIADPADVDGDCIDDITELADPVGMNPVNPAAAIAFSDGTVAVPDQATLTAIASSETYLKFILHGIDTDSPAVYFMNAETHPGHDTFLDVVDIDESLFGTVNGNVAYLPQLVAPDGSLGVYVFWVAYTSYLYPFSLVDLAYTLLAASMPLLKDNLAFWMSHFHLQHAQSDLPLYRESRVNLLFEEDVWPEDFIALNPGEGYGLLRVMEPDERPHPREIVIYEALPNELPRVAGIISTVPQTPLSHVNLRAVQDGGPQRLHPRCPRRLTTSTISWTATFTTR